MSYLLDNFWARSENRRKFLEDIARKHDMDPKNPETWYTIYADWKKFIPKVYSMSRCI